MKAIIDAGRNVLVLNWGFTSYEGNNPNLMRLSLLHFKRAFYLGLN